MQGYIRQIANYSNMSLDAIVTIIVQYRARKLKEYPADCILFGVGDNDSGRIRGDYGSVEYLIPLLAHKDFKHIFIGPAAVFTINTSNTVCATGDLRRGESDDYPFDEDVIMERAGLP